MPNQEFDSPELALEHYGVKGMRWGTRTEQVKAARSAQTSRIEKHFEATNAGQTAKAKQIEKDFLTSPDRITAQRLTRGETIVAAILSQTVPGLGPVVLGSGQAARVQTARGQTNRARKKHGLAPIKKF